MAPQLRSLKNQWRYARPKALTLSAKIFRLDPRNERSHAFTDLSGVQLLNIECKFVLN
jgi:hypothetical protein